MKVKINKSNIELTTNQANTPDVSILFSFEHELMLNGKKLVKPLEVLKIANLTACGNHLLMKNINGNFLILSLGKKEDLNLENFLKSLKALASQIIKNHNITKLNLVIEESLAAALKLPIDYFIEQSVFHLVNYLYFFDEQKSTKQKLELNQINFISKNDISSVIKKALHLIDGLFLLKHLANNSANVATPSYLANTANDFSKLSKKVTVEILSYKEIKKAKMCAFLAVAQGSTEEPKFIQLEYKGGQVNSKPIVLVGKGITFDSGGISIKPSERMEEMKYDMCGAATVLSVFQTVVQLELPINLIVLVPTCENMPS
ncbi:MAG: hypothetical protein K2P99_01635, partial [Burkholderiales bacterium]|nr:hypothetical protein [Burkholderiales bacterium]